MVINKIHNLKHSQGINFIKANQPGVYFLFDVDKKLSYIGESKFPMSRILDHYSRAYQNNKKAKGLSASNLLLHLHREFLHKNTIQKRFSIHTF